MESGEVGVSSSKKHHHHNSYLTTSNGTIKRTNRHLAALDFLLSIPMANEARIKEDGKLNISRIRQHEENITRGMAPNTTRLAHSAYFQRDNSFMLGSMDDMLSSSATLDSVGRRLQGTSAPTARIPLEFRLAMVRNNEKSAVVRLWEDHLLSRGFTVPSPKAITQPLLSSRVFFSRARAYPVGVFSIIKYDPGEEAKKLNKLKADDQKGDEVFLQQVRDWRGFSYKPLFEPLASSRSDDYFFQRGFMYDPNILDDPTMIHGAHRSVSRAAATGPVMCSVIHYVNKKDLKESLNEKFHEMHPQLPPSLTLSKIRNIKKSIVVASMELDVELCTVAYAVIYFERLCLMGLVTKFNRHLTMSVCLLIAFKFLENFTLKSQGMLPRLLDFFDKEWEIPKKDIFKAEFGAYVKLGFSLHIPHQHVYVMYLRLLKLVHRSSRAYLGDDMEHMYTKIVVALEAEEAEAEAEKEAEAEAQAKAKDNDAEADDDDVDLNRTRVDE